MSADIIPFRSKPHPLAADHLLLWSGRDAVGDLVHGLDIVFPDEGSVTLGWWPTLSEARAIASSASADHGLPVRQGGVE